MKRISAFTYIAKIGVLGIFMFTPFFVVAQSQNQNYVKSTQYIQETTTSIPQPNASQANVQITYFDGLGRPIQQIGVAQSSTGGDIVTHMEYDMYGRQTKEYLPFPTQNSSLNFRSDALSLLNNHYESTMQTEFAYSEKLLEASPLNRVLKQAAPGEAWALNTGKEVKFEYQTNQENEVRIFKAKASWSTLYERFDVGLIQNGGFYPTGQLYKTVTIDENNESGNLSLGSTIEFKDKQGRVILKRTFSRVMITLSNGATTQQVAPHDTYYVYDQFGNLTYVIPPLVQTANASDVVTQTLLDKLCYQYIYDKKNRLIEKKLPHKHWEFIIYDKLDRVVATGPAYSPFSDHNAQLGWLITKYDAFNRPIITGWMSATVDATQRKSLQALRNNQTTNFHETKSTTATSQNGINYPYTNVAWPTNFHVLTISYFDNYQFPAAPTSFPTSIIGQDVLQPSTSFKSMPTGSWTRSLTTSTNTQGELTFWLYDKWYRPIQTWTNHINGGYTIVETELNFAGWVQEQYTHHRRDNTDTPTQIRERFEYTPKGLLLTHTHQIENGEIEILEQNEYDDLGKLVTKHLGGSQSYVDDNGKNLQKVDYTYNIRGWLTEINNINDLDADEDLFAFKINYNQPEVYGNQGLFNGNISETLWKSATDNILRGYGYTYDGLNRLRNAFYGENGQLTHAFNEHLSYDKNGNILNLTRNSSLNGFTTNIDQLTYEYDGNQIQKVTDAPNANRHFGFVDGTNTNNDYEYDPFGNMITDRNKGITQIRYNHLNLPIQIQFANGGSISYNYHANGVKFRKFVQNGSVVTETRYIGGFQYMNQKLQFMHLPQGYINVLEGHKPPQERVYDYVYQYKDHLGNIRQSFAFDRDRQEIRTLTEHNYYPFGLEHSYLQTRRRPELVDEIVGEININSDPNTRSTRMVQVDDVRYQYKFQGQERQDELGLNWDSFKWRNYDYAIGRFMSIDPLTEEYNTWSPYTFSGNRVIDARELEGLEPYSVHATEEAAAQNWGEHYNGASVLRGIEMGSTIFTQTITLPSLSPLISTPITLTVFSYNDAALGTADTTAVNSTIPTGATATADIHAHGEFLAGYDNNIFSGLHPTDNKLSTTGDIGDNNSNGLNGYVTTPNGSLQKYEPSTGTVTTVSTNLQSDPKDPTRLNTNAPVDNLPPSP
jgi:RHS repeat-associated protein